MALSSASSIASLDRPMENLLQPSDKPRKRSSAWRLLATVALGCAFLAGSKAGAQANGALDIKVPTAASAGMQRQQLVLLLQKRLPEAPPGTAERVARDFLDHLRETSSMAAEDFSAGRMDPDDLASRVDVYLGDHPELTGQPQPAVTGDPRKRVADMLARESGMPQGTEERMALADKFLRNLAELSSTARDNLLAGRMTDDELQSRVTVFASDYRADKSRAVADPATAAVPGIIESFVKANLGPVNDRASAVCFRGSEENKGANRGFVIFKKRPNKIRIHVLKDGQLVGIVAYDGSNAWREAPGKPAILVTGPEAAAVAESARFDGPLVGYAERGASVRLEGGPEDNPIRLRIIEANGITRVATIDPATYDEISLRTVRGDGRWVETKFSDYRKVGSLSVAYLQQQYDAAGLESTTRITDVSLEPGLIDRFFEPPNDPNFGYMDFIGGLAVLQARQAAGANKVQATQGGKP